MRIKYFENKRKTYALAKCVATLSSKWVIEGARITDGALTHTCVMRKNAESVFFFPRIN